MFRNTQQSTKISATKRVRPSAQTKDQEPQPARSELAQTQPMTEFSTSFIQVSLNSARKLGNQTNIRKIIYLSNNVNLLDRDSVVPDSSITQRVAPVPTPNLSQTVSTLMLDNLHTHTKKSGSYGLEVDPETQQPVMTFVKANEIAAWIDAVNKQSCYRDSLEGDAEIISACFNRGRGW